eukprot:CAMPEP_0198214956 /NCGR_PEP_ID=MMETSP1445-20131203/45767_1 /TAXON_ID=36898 /ORGANISM="Pyramimonas sp., Strain CCMP2087" /LENGTH=263 /DNA_ID=CAMNT_0043890415 /DNA_START=19 /DNA_END=810 /DNA_ORIENTATION=+
MAVATMSLTFSSSKPCQFHRKYNTVSNVCARRLSPSLAKRPSLQFEACRTGRREPRGMVTRCEAKDEQAKLEQSYTFHTPGSVQEPTEEASGVVFAHQLPEEAPKWKGTHITHVGDTKQDKKKEKKKKLGIVIGEFHDQLMNACLEDARLAAESMNAEITKVVWVPGSYEALLPVKHMMEDKKIDAVIMLGYIEKGSTLHGQEMGSTCSLILKQMELQYDKPLGMGIIGPGATAEQAAQRVAYAGNATRAAVRMCHYMDTYAH